MRYENKSLWMYNFDLSYQILLYICEVLKYFDADVAVENDKFQFKGFPVAKKIKYSLTMSL